MRHEPRNYERLITEMRGALSETQLRAHFTLYQGYVKKLNEIEQALATVDKETAAYQYGAYSELRRREPVAYNGTVLHEHYFENLGGPSGQKPPELLKAAVERSFGSWEIYLADFKACVASGHGWTLTTYDWNFDVVRNNLVRSEHDLGLLPNQSLLVVIDHWEHAYFVDYQTKKPDYTKAMLEHIHWATVAERVKNTPLGMVKKPPAK